MSFSEYFKRTHHEIPKSQLFHSYNNFPEFVEGSRFCKFASLIQNRDKFFFGGVRIRLRRIFNIFPCYDNDDHHKNTSKDREPYLGKPRNRNQEKNIRS